MTDFVEIGTSDFDALCQTHSGSGLVIEPLKFYLDKLPNRPNQTKLNIAISADDCETTVDIYYIPPNVIEEKKLPEWLKGCNSINRPHPAHSDYPYYVKDTVQSRPLWKVLEENDVTEIGHLKIDTEGMDCKILQLYGTYLLDKPYKPKRITFEANYLTPVDEINKTLRLYESIGYREYKREDSNIILRYFG